MLVITTATLVPALALWSTLTGLVLAAGPRTQCTMDYRIPQGATCDTVEQETTVTPSEIESMNPGVKCNSTLTVGDYLCTKQYTPTCTLNETATSTTCDELAAKWTISVTDFVEYNSDVDDACDDLVVGNPYCVSVDGCYPGNSDEICKQ